MKPVAFKSNAGRMGYRELFRVAGSPGIGVLACVLKLFRIIGPENDGYGMRSLGDSLQRLDFDELPRQVSKATAGYWSKLEKLGFLPVFAYTIETFGCQEAYGQVFRSKDGITAVSIAYARCVKGPTETETTVFGFNTMLTDDTYIMTSGNKRLMNKPATFSCEFMPGASPQAVLERHLERVERAEAQPRKIKTEGDLERLVLNCENEETDFNIERGVYVRMSREEIELGTELKEDWERDNARGSGISRNKKKEDDDEDDEDDEDEDGDEEDVDDEEYKR
jgi:hypothetical protein